MRRRGRVMVPGREAQVSDAEYPRRELVKAGAYMDGAARSRACSERSPGDALSGRDLGCALEAELADRGLAHLELLDLPGHGHRVLVDEADVARHLRLRDL